MISEVVDPPERLRDAAQELAEKIAQNSPAAMAATKRALWGALELGLTDACRAGAAELVSMWGHPDQEEGPRAFAEKREPRVAAARASARLMTEVAIGTAVVALHRTARRAGASTFNRWYERDHFYAAATGGPGRVRGRALGRERARARRCARRARLVRRSAHAARSSRRYWLLAGTQAEWDAWVARQMGDARGRGDRMFAGRDHLHTAVYRFAAKSRADDGAAGRDRRSTTGSRA